MTGINKIKKKTINSILSLKQEGKNITALTAYDYSTAKLIDEAGIDIVLVGDSLAMVALGYETTHEVSMEEMLIFVKAVSKGAKNALVIADMPFMSYHSSENKAIENAGKFIKAGAKAIKLEGGSDYVINTTKRCVDVGIPVLGHLGFTPQFLHTLGGYKVQGKNIENTTEIIKQAQALEKAGAFGVVLEMVPEESARIITESINIPTISIGAGRYCSGQILVTDDVIGKFTNFKPKFARKYADTASVLKEAFINYKQDVIENKFPSDNEVFHLAEEEKERLNNAYFK